MKKHKKDEMEKQVQAEESVTEENVAAGNDSNTAALETKLAEKEKEAAVNYDKYVHAIADMENYKKRAAKEKAEVVKYGKEEVIKDMLPFIDSLDRALEHAETSTEIKSFKEGIKLIQDQLLNCLKKHGVEVIECTGKEFDPNYHEAMMQIDSEDHEANKIVNEFQRGYLLNGRLLRPSKVSVCIKTNKENNIADQCEGKGE